ncbi:MAG TPA: universal stress protein [Chloroflexota bacterium]|nr:universal stress protein [Chloroflexota bacterium]
MTAGESTGKRAEPNPSGSAADAPLPEKPAPHRGKLTVYLGAAPGVGKTYAMLQEAHRLKSRGADVVVGFVETHGRAHTAEQIGDLEIVPPREIPYKGVTLREMDTDAVLARHPQIVLVDEMAHTNVTQGVPGSRYEKRYQDIEDLLRAGIDVISTVNIQHLESLNDYVRQLTGIHVHETIPDWVLDEADEIELIDMAPQALIRRMIHGNIYPVEQSKRALENFFTVGNLTALRDLALRATAKEVEEKLAAAMRGYQVESPSGREETIMVAVDHQPTAKNLIRSGRRMASALKGGLVVVYVEPSEGHRQAQTNEQERQLRENLHLADRLDARVVRLRGKVSEELIAYARANNVSQIIIGHPSHSRLEEFLHGSVTSDILRELPGVDVHVVADADRTHE